MSVIDPISAEELDIALDAYFSDVVANAPLEVISGENVYCAPSAISLDNTARAIFDGLSGSNGLLLGVALATSIFQSRVLDGAHRRQA